MSTEERFKREPLWWLTEAIGIAIFLVPIAVVAWALWGIFT